MGKTQVLFPRNSYIIINSSLLKYHADFQPWSVAGTGSPPVQTTVLSSYTLGSYCCYFFMPAQSCANATDAKLSDDGLCPRWGWNHAISDLDRSISGLLAA